MNALTTTQQGAVLTLTLSRSEVRNAFNDDVIAEITAAFQDAATRADVRAVVLAAVGPAFCAGADLNWMRRLADYTREENLADAGALAEMLRVMYECPKPTVARVQGAALGGGVGLACACDIAVAADNASFSVSEAKFGILPAVIGPYVMNAVGKRQARRLALTATRIGAAEALAIGLVQQVCPLDALDATVHTVLGELLNCGPQAQVEIKALYAQMAPGPITPEVRELTAQTISRVRGTPEAREGFAAFLGKRPASWINPAPQTPRNTP